MAPEGTIIPRLNQEPEDQDLMAWLQEINVDGNFSLFEEEEHGQHHYHHHGYNNNISTHPMRSAPNLYIKPEPNLCIKQEPNVCIKQEPYSSYEPTFSAYESYPAQQPHYAFEQQPQPHREPSSASVKTEPASPHRQNLYINTKSKDYVAPSPPAQLEDAQRPVKVRRTSTDSNHTVTDMYSDIPTPVASPTPSWCSDAAVGKKRPRSATPPAKAAVVAAASVTKLKAASANNASSNSLSTKATAMSIFMKHIKITEDGIDASGIISRECFEDWLASREKMPLRPEECYRKSLLCHLTCSDGGSCPFTPEVETAVLALLRQSGQIWPAFQNRVNAEGRVINIGIKGLRCLGFHERKTQPGDTANVVNNAVSRRKSKAARTTKSKTKRYTAYPMCYAV
mmetsp:Transcript_17111/g.33509  ORF Transcript_17111/g.33509 Transcript_17111/m.33509 type:complete len:397 (-) Transcript_17111:155-1345(-)|eukprot:CAMPEP_0171496188 /NCGR_PEP_ID=MMETSP0958-20121227/6560_1 /TAXON_ID=87120 /ORGANISM="Aurantiochytrium limacinum, Strain ATCCMYA-1381" /LENGTH=396 /DNA_ID=CAMNT_0012030257 /DNA_START=282 /DNA_END=1472 /DNA_ORIENTATION=-